MRATKIATLLSLPRTTIYDNLRKLVQKGLAREYAQANIKLFELEPINHLEHIVNDRRLKLKNELGVVTELNKHLPTVISDLKKELSDELPFLDNVKNLFYSEKFEEVKLELSNSSFEKLVVELGLDFLDFITSDLLSKFPDDPNLKNLSLGLLKHQGKFSEFIDQTRDLNLLSASSQIIYLEYLNIVGEQPTTEFINKLKRLVYSDSTQLERLFVPAYGEYLWLFNGVDEAIDYIDINTNKYKSFFEYQGKIHFLKGEFLRHKGSYEEALILYEKALNSLLKTYEKRYLALTYKSMSVCYRNLNKWEKSLEFVTEAISISRIFEDKSLIARTVLSLGSFYEVKNNPAKALKYHQEAFKLGKEMNSIRDEFYAGQNIGITLLQLGNVGGAYKTLTETLRSAKKLGRDYYLKMWLGFIKTQQPKKFEAGIRMIKECKKIAIENNEQKRIDIANSLIGSSYYLNPTHKKMGGNILLELQKTTSSSVIKEGISELLSGVEFHKTKLCS